MSFDSYEIKNSSKILIGKIRKGSSKNSVLLWENVDGDEILNLKNNPSGSELYQAEKLIAKISVHSHKSFLKKIYEDPESWTLSIHDLSFDKQLASIVHDTETVKKGLASKGEYNCCVMPTCNWCLLNDKHCGCAIHLNEGHSVCGECGQAWAIGRGVLAGVEAEDVKWGPKEVHAHWYDDLISAVSSY